MPKDAQKKMVPSDTGEKFVKGPGRDLHPAVKEAEEKLSKRFKRRVLKR